MTDTVFIGVGSHRARAIVLRVANRGPWVAELDMVDDVALTGAVELQFGALTLHGTVVPQQAGTFGEQTSLHVVGGGAGWGRQLPAKAYHNDAGVKARLLAEDAARDAGETLGSFVATPERIGLDYVRAAGTASATLEYAAATSPWWVDFAGVTNVGLRPEVELPAKSYVLLNFEPATQVAELAVDDLSALTVGSVISDERLGASLVVRDFELTTKDNSPLRATVWCGGLNTEPGRLPGLLRAIVRRLGEGALHGCYRYRVATMLSDGRCELQAVRTATGLPDLRPVLQWPGAPGLAPRLALGAEVLVQFIDSDPAQPVITHYAGEGGAGFIPASFVLSASGNVGLSAGAAMDVDGLTVRIGGVGALAAARLGDSVSVALPPSAGGGVATGVITSASGKVTIA